MTERAPLAVQDPIPKLRIAAIEVVAKGSVGGGVPLVVEKLTDVGSDMDAMRR